MDSVSIDRTGRKTRILSSPDSRHSVLVLPDPLEKKRGFVESLVPHVIECKLNLLIPEDANSWWVDRPGQGFVAPLTSERYIVQLASDPELLVPGPRALIGGEAAVRLGFQYPRLFPVVAAWDAAFDFHEHYGTGTSLDSLFDRREQARQFTAILQVRQSETPRDVWFGCPQDSIHFRGHDRLHEKLLAVGVDHEFVVCDHGPFDSMIQFIARQLDAESRRLL